VTVTKNGQEWALQLGPACQAALGLQS
jgi:hypothetical protein